MNSGPSDVTRWPGDGGAGSHDRCQQSTVMWVVTWRKMMWVMVSNLFFVFLNAANANRMLTSLPVVDRTAPLLLYSSSIWVTVASWLWPTSHRPVSVHGAEVGFRLDIYSSAVCSLRNQRRLLTVCHRVLAAPGRLLLPPSRRLRLGVENVIETFTRLGLVLHTCSCCWGDIILQKYLSS